MNNTANGTWQSKLYKAQDSHKYWKWEDFTRLAVAHVGHVI